jgi:endonuclease/exonuclease/phosphatase family metal-dependent hydrolase
MPMNLRSDRAITCVTWNVHRGRGEDGIVDPARTADVLVSEVLDDQVDVLALQEADDEVPPHGGFLDIADIESRTGLVYAHTEQRLRWGNDSHGFLGSILFLKPTYRIVAADVLDLPGHCHRGAVIVEVEHAGQHFRLVTAHLSRPQILRFAQMRTLGQYLRRQRRMQTILLGDLNEWRPWSGMAFSPRIVGTRFQGPAPATFPVARPFLPLDRIMSDRAGNQIVATVCDGPGIRMASDHRPLRGVVPLEQL